MEHARDIPQTPDFVVNGGAFGWSIAATLARRHPNLSTHVVLHRESDVAEARRTRLASRLFAGEIKAAGQQTEALLNALRLPENTTFSTPEEFADADVQIDKLWIPTLPSAATRSGVRSLLAKNAMAFATCDVLCATKGMELGTLKLPHEIVEDELRAAGINTRVTTMLGGNLAVELARGDPMLAEIAGKPAETKRIARYFEGSPLRIYRSRLRRRLALAGATKNVQSIASGVAAAEGYGHSTLATLEARSLAEYERLAAAALFRNGAWVSIIGPLATLTHARGYELPFIPNGRGVKTDYGLSLISGKTRNFKAGIELHRLTRAGMSIADALTEIGKSGKTFEGVVAAAPLHAYARSVHVRAPIIETVADVLIGAITIEEAATRLRSRPTR